MIDEVLHRHDKGSTDNCHCSDKEGDVDKWVPVLDDDEVQFGLSLDDWFVEYERWRSIVEETLTALPREISCGIVMDGYHPELSICRPSDTVYQDLHWGFYERMFVFRSASTWNPIEINRGTFLSKAWGRQHVPRHVFHYRDFPPPWSSARHAVGQLCNGLFFHYSLLQSNLHDLVGLVFLESSLTRLHSLYQSQQASVKAHFPSRVWAGVDAATEPEEIFASMRVTPIPSEVIDALLLDPTPS